MWLMINPTRMLYTRSTRAVYYGKLVKLGLQTYKTSNFKFFLQRSNGRQVGNDNTIIYYYYENSAG